MPGLLGFSLLDYSNEKSSTGIITGDVTGASLPGLLTQVGTLRGAIEGITLGVVSNERLSVFDTQLTTVPPTDEQAQVERAWYVAYEDSVNHKLFGITIGTADVAGRLLPESDKADLANTEIAAFVTAFEAVARSPYGNTVNVIRITHVGRNR